MNHYEKILEIRNIVNEIETLNDEKSFLMKAMEANVKSTNLEDRLKDELILGFKAVIEQHFEHYTSLLEKSLVNAINEVSELIN